MSNKFDKSLRLLKKSQFINVRKKGCRRSASHLAINYCNSNKEFSRIGLIARKSIGNAVKRNYLKRIVREYFRKNRRFYKNNDYVIIFKKYTNLHSVITDELNLLLNCEKKI